MIKYFNHIVISLGLIIVNSFCFSQNLDSLKHALKNAKHDTTRCNILNAIVESEPNEKVWTQYNEQLKTLAEKNSIAEGPLQKIYLKYLAAALCNIGFYYGNQGNIPKALEYFNKGLTIQKEIGYKTELAYTLSNIGVIYEQQGDITRALEYFHKSLKICEEENSKIGISYALNNIGTIYSSQGDNKNALKYFQMSLIKNEEIGDKSGIANALNNIGVVFRSQGEFLKALVFFKRSLKFQQEIEDKNGIGQVLSHIGSIYSALGDITNALEYYKKGLKIQEEVEDKAGIAYALNNLADVMIRKGDLKQALLLANKGMQTANEVGFPVSISQSAITLKTIYLKQNKYKEAYEMYELEIKMRDSINNQETQKAAVKKEMQYTYEKKELETKAAQDKKDVVAKAELKQKENERNYFIVGFGLVAVLALFILRGYKLKQKANAIILEQKKLVEEKQKEIVDSINYAKRIQMALLPSEKYIERNLKKLNTHEGK